MKKYSIYLIIISLFFLSGMAKKPTITEEPSYISEESNLVMKLRDGATSYYQYDKYTVAIVSPEGIAGENIYAYSSRTNKLTKNTCKKLWRKEPVFSSEHIYGRDPMGVWFKGIYNNYIYIMEGTSKISDNIFYDMKSSTVAFSFISGIYIYNKERTYPTINNGILTCDIEVPYKEEYKNTPRASSLTNNEIEYGFKKVYIATLTINLNKFDVSYNNVREEIINEWD